MEKWKQGTRAAAWVGLLALAIAGSSSDLRAQAAEQQTSKGATATNAVTDDSATTQEAEQGGYWELGAFVGLLNDEPEYRPDDMPDQLRRDALIGARGSYTLPFGLFVEAQGSNSLVKVNMAGPVWEHTRNVNIFFIESALGYNFDLSSRFDAFLGGGAGVAILRPDGLPNETDFAVNYGAGGRYKFANSRMAVRADVRMHQVIGAFEDTRIAMADMAPARDLFALELSVGVSVFLGR